MRGRKNGANLCTHIIRTISTKARRGIYYVHDDRHDCSLPRYAYSHIMEHTISPLNMHFSPASDHDGIHATHSSGVTAAA